MKKFFEKYICSTCKCTKENCFDLIVVNKHEVISYKCTNYKKGKIEPYKEKFIDEYFENRNSIINKKQKKFSKYNNKSTHKKANDYSI